VEVQFIDRAEFPEITRQVGGLDVKIDGLAMAGKLVAEAGRRNYKFRRCFHPDA